jgi:hypothetical protein
MFASCPGLHRLGMNRTLHTFRTSSHRWEEKTIYFHVERSKEPCTILWGRKRKNIILPSQIKLKSTEFWLILKLIVARNATTHVESRRSSGHWHGRDYSCTQTQNRIQTSAVTQAPSSHRLKAAMVMHGRTKVAKRKNLVTFCPKPPDHQR